MEVLLFGVTKELAGMNRLQVPAEASVGCVKDLKDWLAREYPKLGGLSSLAVAVDHEYADDAQLLRPDSEIALIPPVSGG